MKTKTKIKGKARIVFQDGRVETFNDPKLAYSVWLSLPHGIHAAFRGPEDTRPVQPWDYVDKP